MPEPDFIDMAAYADRELPTDIERAWAAGFFDGEGWIGARKAKGYVYLKMAVVQTGSTVTLERFNAAIGGVGRIYPRSKRQPEHWAPGWTLQVNVIGSVVFAVNLLWPHLSAPKREQVVSAFAKRAEYRATWSSEVRYARQTLSDDDVREIRRMCAEGVLQKEIAAKFSIHLTSVSHIKSGKLRGNVA